MTQLVSVVVLLVVAAVLLRLALGDRGDDAAPALDGAAIPIPPVPPARPGPALRPHPATRPATPDGTVTAAAPVADTAAAGRRRTRLFGVGSIGGDGVPHDGPYAVIGYATTGFTPVRDRVVSLSVVHADAAGRVEGRWSTHLAPGRAALPPHLEGEAGAIHQAPSFARVAAHLLTLLEGRVVVTQHPEFLEAFLDAHLMEAGVLAPSLPALSTFEVARSTFPTRNHRLTTLARHVTSDATPGRSALDDALATAALLPEILRQHGARLRYPIAAHGNPSGVLLPTAGRPAPGDAANTWLAAVFAGASGLARELNDTRVARFLDVLVPLLLQGRLVTEEVRGLTRLMVAAGYAAGELRSVQERLLESLRRAAFEHTRLDRMHLHHLRATAISVGIPTYFDDLIPPEAPPAPPPGSGSFSRPVRKPLPPAPPPRLPRCGHCLAMGHYTSQCPRRERGPVRAIAPV